MSDSISPTDSGGKSDGTVVRDLESRRVRKQEGSLFTWDGKNDSGVVVLDGEYEIYITSQDLTGMPLAIR